MNVSDDFKICELGAPRKGFCPKSRYDHSTPTRNLLTKRQYRRVILCPILRRESPVEIRGLASISDYPIKPGLESNGKSLAARQGLFVRRAASPCSKDAVCWLDGSELAGRYSESRMMPISSQTQHPSNTLKSDRISQEHYRQVSSPIPSNAPFAARCCLIITLPISGGTNFQFIEATCHRNMRIGLPERLLYMT